MGDALDSGDVARIFKAMAQTAKLTAEEIARVSGHSTRVGAAQDMVRYGVNLVGAMQPGRWKTSAMVARYSARLLAQVRWHGADRRSTSAVLMARERLTGS